MANGVADNWRKQVEGVAAKVVTRIQAGDGRGVLPTNRHGSEGTVSRIIMDVEDPATGKVRSAVLNVRSKGIDHMHSRGTITDTQKDVADRFLALAERAASSGVKAIDYSKVTVDCGSLGDCTLSERQVRAIHELAGVRRILGGRAYKLLCDVIVEGRAISAMAAEHYERTGRTARDYQGYLSFRLAEALDQLSAHWDTVVGTGSGPRHEMMGGESDLRTAPVEVKLAVPKFKTTEEALAHVEKVAATLRGMIVKKAQILEAARNG